jgi:hypothetical protein
MCSLVPALLNERWEPSWEPFAVDCCGRLWTTADSEPVGSGRYGPLRTPMDYLRPSTDRKVGDSSSSGRAAEAPAVQGVSIRRSVTVAESRHLFLGDFLVEAVGDAQMMGWPHAQDIRIQASLGLRAWVACPWPLWVRERVLPAMRYLIDLWSRR